MSSEKWSKGEKPHSLLKKNQVYHITFAIKISILYNSAIMTELNSGRFNGSEDQGRGKIPPREVSREVFDDVMQELTGGRTKEEIGSDLARGRWPFAVSEEQMRADLERWELAREAERKWENLTPDEKTEQILYWLVQSDLQIADPVFSSIYIRAISETGEAEDRARLDSEMSKRVDQLRQEGKMVPEAQLRERAESMLYLDPNGMRRAFHDFSAELLAKKGRTV